MPTPPVTPPARQVQPTTARMVSNSWSASLSLALKGISARWVELVLGAAVLALPVAAVRLHTALSESKEGTVHELAHKLGRNMLVVPANTDLQRFYTGDHGKESLPPGYVDKLRTSHLSKHLGSIQARLYGKAQVAGTDAVVVGETVWRGNEERSPTANGSAMMGQELATQLSSKPGDSLRVAGHTLHVAGVQESTQDGPADGILTTGGDARTVLGQEGWSALRLAGCWCRLNPADLGRQVEQLLPGTRAITVAGMLEAQKGVVEVARQYTHLVRFSGLLLAAAVGWALSVSYAQRNRREIGLLIAVGARPWMIAGQVVMRAALMGLFGAAAGWALFLAAGPRLITWLTGPVTASSMSAPNPESFWVLAGIAIAVCAAGAIAPAMDAAKADPVEALREE